MNHENSTVRFSVQLTKQDFDALHNVVRQRLIGVARANGVLLGTNILAWTALALAGAAFIGMYRDHPELTFDLSVVAVFILGGAMLFAVGIAFQQRVYRRAALSDCGAFMTEQSLEASAEGLVIETAVSRAVWEWKAFIDSVEDESYLFLLLDNVHAIVVPKRALEAGQLKQVRSWIPSPRRGGQ